MERAVMFALLMSGLWLVGGQALEARAQAPGDATHEVQRAPGGSLRRGLVDTPAWVVWGAAALVTVGAATALGRRLRRTE